MDFVTAYGPKLSISLDFSDEPMVTKQSFAADADINNILAKYQITGLTEFVNEHEASYGVVPADDFQASMEIVAQAHEMFEDLPSSMRKRFANDPAAMLSFLQDPDNRDEAVKLGFIDAPEPPPSPPEPISVRVVDPPTTPPF